LIVLVDHWRRAPMTESSGSPSAATRDRLEQELAQARRQRDRLAGQLGGEDADDPDTTGDSGDAALQLEGQDDLARVDGRIEEIERQLAGGLDAGPGLADGTRVTVRFPGGDTTTLRVVTIPEQASADDQDDVVTADSPLGRALVGKGAGETITYEGPDGDLQAEVVAVEAP
jgi:transcription elongation factor GreA